MLKTLSLAGALSIVLGGSVLAQGVSGPDLPAQDLPSNGGAGARTGNITSTGATVPNPGVSQSGGTTSMDIGIQKEDSKIDSSICKGC